MILSVCGIAIPSVLLSMVFYSDMSVLLSLGELKNIKVFIEEKYSLNFVNPGIF